MSNFLRLSLCLLCFGLSTGAFSSNEPTQTPAVEQSVTQDPLTANLISENGTIQPGHSFWVAVQMHADDHWHAYWKNPGDAGMPPVIDWNLPEGFTVVQTLWPSPKRFNVASSVGFGYEGDFALLVEILPPASAKEGTVDIAGQVRWVVCSDATCLPGESDITLSMLVSSTEPVAVAAQSDKFKQLWSKIPQKHEGIVAKRTDNLLEISFPHTDEETQKIESVEFFSEKHKTINDTVPPLFEPSAENPGQYTVVLEEIASEQLLKGILVLHTSSGDKAYTVDLSVNNVGDDIAVALSDHEKSNTSEHVQQQSVHHDFDFKGGVVLAIIFAFIGGMLLNLMPCVLPVISFKILSFIKLSGESRKLIFKHGLAFSGGVLASFWVLASMLLVLQAYGRSAGWGFQLQEPLFVAILAAFIFVFGLSLFGMFELGTSIMAKAGAVQGKPASGRELLGSFLSGVLATAVATPCTGPFLGSAVGFAVTLPPLQAMLIFTSLALGMSLPYLALAAFPSLLRFLPKPGPWMETFKQLMGFLMIASVIWLVWVFGAQSGSFAVTLLLAGFFFMAIACWIYGRWATPVCKKRTRAIGTAFALAFFVMGSYVVVQASSSWAQAMGGHSLAHNASDTWEEFSPKRVAELQKQGIPVFIDFTAKWCLICQANHLVLSKDDVSQKFKEKGIVRMKADWTKRDEVIAEQLRKFGRNSVPLYVLYNGDEHSQPQILPQILTPDIVVGALEGL